MESNGAVSWRAAYEAFGEATQLALAQGPVTKENLLRFPGQYYDGETGTHYNFHRDYDSGLGRYVQSDPIGLSGGFNIYLYANANSNFYIDSLGLFGSSPGIGDQINPGGIRGDGVRSYEEYFEKRFPNVLKLSRIELISRIIQSACSNIGKVNLPPVEDKDIYPDFMYFGGKKIKLPDENQSWYEKKVKIGKFELKTESINISWDENCNDNCFSYSTNIYVQENTGDNRARFLGMTRERTVRMGEWELTGSACCDD